MSPLRFVWLSLWYHGRLNVAVALGVIAGTAVLSGALLVGDSVRGSLRHLALDRLARVEFALVAPRLFRAELAEELSASDSFRANFGPAVPVLLLDGSLAQPERKRRANRVNIIGCDRRFFDLSNDEPPVSVAQI